MGQNKKKKKGGMDRKHIVASPWAVEQKTEDRPSNQIAFES